MLFILNTLIQRRKLIMTAALVSALVMAGVSLILPKWYRAATSLLPPEEQAPIGLGMLQNLQMPIFGGAAFGANPSTMYVDILQSRAVGERIIEEFELKPVFGKTLMSEALAELAGRTSTILMENGLLFLSYEDQDPERAAAVANRYVDYLDEFNRQLAATRASKTRAFIEKQIEIRLLDMRRAEEDLRTFQEEHNALELEEQIRSSIEVVSDLSAQAIALEVELEMLEHYASKDSDEYIRKQREYSEIMRQLRGFRSGTDDPNDEDILRSFFPPFDEVPHLALELARRLRQVTVTEKVFELLVQEYEKARIEEARDTPTVQVLDRATVPEKRSRPKRKFLVVMGGILGIAWSSLLAIVMGLWSEDPERSGAMRDLVKPLVSDLNRLRGKRN